MELIIQVILLFVGFVALTKGADIFVDASVDIARIYRIPGVIVGLTIIALGTSAPEIVISISATLTGSTDMAVGNIVGSNIFNLVFILGLCAAIKPIPVRFKEIAKEHTLGILAAIAILAMQLIFVDVIPRIYSFGLLIGFAMYMYFTIKSALRSKDTDQGNANFEPPLHSLKRNAIFATIGLGLIIVGGQLAVTYAVNIALIMGISERIVGLTILAVGTSAPELITSLMAIKKNQIDMAVGNVVGSSIFNILFILGMTGSMLPLTVDHTVIFDLVFLIASSILFLLFAYTGKRISRLEGATLFLLYAGYMTSLVVT